MYTVKITVLRKADYKDLQAKYENPIEHACDLREGQVFYSDDGMIPKGLCESAWQSLSPFVFALANGASDFYDGWMQDKRSACVSCNDGFRPVSFLLQSMESKETK